MEELTGEDMPSARADGLEELTYKRAARMSDIVVFRAGTRCADMDAGADAEVEGSKQEDGLKELTGEQDEREDGPEELTYKRVAQKSDVVVYCAGAGAPAERELRCAVACALGAARSLWECLDMLEEAGFVADEASLQRVQELLLAGAEAYATKELAAELKRELAAVGV